MLYLYYGSAVHHCACVGPLIEQKENKMILHYFVPKKYNANDDKALKEKWMEFLMGSLSTIVTKYLNKNYESYHPDIWLAG